MVSKLVIKQQLTRMWANARRDGSPAEYRWRPLFNAAKFGWRPLLECRAVTLPRRKTRWTEGATYIRQDDHQVGHWPTFLVLWIKCSFSVHLLNSTTTEMCSGKCRGKVVGATSSAGSSSCSLSSCRRQGCQWHMSVADGPVCSSIKS